jgi:hypothetical protein
MTAPRAVTVAANQPDPNSSTACYGHRRVRHLGLARNDVRLQALCAAISLRRALALGSA